MIAFKCSQCGKSLKTQDDSAGRQASCPKCGATVVVPVSQEAGRLHARWRGLLSSPRFRALAIPITAALVAVIGGYFLGRWNFKHELRSEFCAGFAAAREETTSEDETTSEPEGAFTGNPLFAGVMERAKRAAREVREQSSPAGQARLKRGAAYARNHVRLYGVVAKHYDSLLDGRVPGVEFKLQNNGDKTLTKVSVTVYFKDRTGKTIHEASYRPLASFEELRPGYIWQMERGKFYTTGSVPSEWQTGAVTAKITECEIREKPAQPDN